MICVLLFVQALMSDTLVEMSISFKLTFNSKKTCITLNNLY